MISKLKIGETEYPFRFTLNDLIEFGEETGRDDMRSFGEISSPKDIRKAAWLGMKSGAKAQGDKFQMTEEQLGSIMSFSDLEVVVKLLTQSLFPQKNGEEKKTKPKVKER